MTGRILLGVSCLDAALINTEQSSRLRNRLIAIINPRPDFILEFLEDFLVVLTRGESFLRVLRRLWRMHHIVVVVVVEARVTVGVEIARHGVVPVVVVVVVRYPTRGRGNREGRGHVGTCGLFTWSRDQELGAGVFSERGDGAFTVLLVGSTLLLPILTRGHGISRSTACGLCLAFFNSSTC
jgi:hypothetical protein